MVVLPLRESKASTLPDSELKVEAVNLGGKGGQHQNKTCSGCRITHIPTGMQVAINGRNYHSNQRAARRILAARVAEHRQSSADAKYAAYRREQVQGGHRSGKLRTYNFMEGRVVDHRLGTKTGNVKAVMKGQLEKILKPKRKKRR